MLKVGPVEVLPCQWCGDTYWDHVETRASGAPAPRTPCLGLRSGFMAKREKAPETPRFDPSCGVPDCLICNGETHAPE